MGCRFFQMSENGKYTRQHGFSAPGCSSHVIFDRNSRSQRVSLYQAGMPFLVDFPCVHRSALDKWRVVVKAKVFWAKRRGALRKNWSCRIPFFCAGKFFWTIYRVIPVTEFQWKENYVCTNVEETKKQKLWRTTIPSHWLGLKPLISLQFPHFSGLPRFILNDRPLTKSIFASIYKVFR